MSDVSSALREVTEILESDKPHVISRDGVTKITSWSPTTVGATTTLGTNSIVRRMLLDAVSRSEMEAPGSGELCLAIATELCNQLTAKNIAGCNPGVALDELGVSREIFCDVVRRQTKPSRGKSVKGILESILDDGRLSDQIISAIDLAGFAGKISVDRETSDIGSVSVAVGHTFDVLTFSSVTKDHWTGDDVTIIPIDGYVEKVSEIHGILEKVTGGPPTVIISRGFSEDVISTLSVNKMRGTLNVMPVVAQFDNAGANVLKDVAVICGTDVISSLKGELICSIDVEKFHSLAKKATIRSGKLTLFAPENAGVKAHADDIKKRIAELDANNGLREMLEKRLLSLLSGSVTIVLSHEYRNKLELVDLALRTFKSIVSYGLVDVSSIEKNMTDAFGVDPKDYLRCSSVSPVTLTSPVRYGVSAAGSIANFGAILKLDLKNGS